MPFPCVRVSNKPGTNPPGLKKSIAGATPVLTGATNGGVSRRPAEAGHLDTILKGCLSPAFVCQTQLGSNPSGLKKSIAGATPVLTGATNGGVSRRPAEAGHLDTILKGCLSPAFVCQTQLGSNPSGLKKSIAGATPVFTGATDGGVSSWPAARAISTRYSWDAFPLCSCVN